MSTWNAFRITAALTGAVMVGEAIAPLVGLLSHAYRDREYLARAANPFLFNTPLFVVNNLKLLRLLTVAITDLGLGSSR